MSRAYMMCCDCSVLYLHPSVRAKRAGGASVQNSVSNRHSPYWIASVACTPNSHDEDTVCIVFKASRSSCRPRSPLGEPVADATPFTGDDSPCSCRRSCNSPLSLPRAFARSVESLSLSIVKYVGYHTPVGPPPIALPVSEYRWLYS